MPKAHPRLVILGLDGLPWSLAKLLANSGDFPGLAQLTKSQNCYPIQAELPELSPVNWTSFYTAAGPESHGIFGFIHLNPQDYSLFRTSPQDVQCSNIFEILGGKNFLIKAINLPHTYPAKPLNGWLISGFISETLEQAVYPKYLLPRLIQEDYKLEADTIKGSSDYHILLTELSHTIASRQKALQLFWPDLAWHLFILVLTETDRLSHFLFPALVDKNHHWHTPCIQLLQKWDQLIHEILERYHYLPEPKRLIVLADHGFTSLHSEVDLNCWLKENRFLTFDHPARNELDASCISGSSLAFALDPSRIYIHEQNKFKKGKIHYKDKNKVLTDLQAGLSQLNYHGQPVFKKIFKGTNLYPNANSLNQPDLVCLPNPGFELKAKFNRVQVFGHFERQGTHTFDNAFFYDSSGACITRVREAGQLVLDFFQAPVI